MTEILTQITRLAVLVFLLSSMAGIGLGLSFRQAAAPLKDVRFVAFALLANFFIAPLLAIAIVRLFHLQEPFAIGLLLIGLAAGAPFMPKVAGFAKGDAALSVALMVMLMGVTTVFLPVALPLLIKGAQVDPLGIARFLVLLLLLPLVAGLVLKARSESIAARLRPVLERLSTIAVVVLLALILILYFDGVRQIFGTGAIAAGILFTALTSGVAWLLGGRDRERRTILCLGAGLRNLPAALLVAVQNFEDPRVTVMVIVTTLAGILMLAPFAARIGKRAGDGAVPANQ